MVSLLKHPRFNMQLLLTQHLPKFNLNTVYFTNSGTEATEGALKLAKRVTNEVRWWLQQFISWIHAGRIKR